MLEPPFEIHDSRKAAFVRVTLVGELDISSAGALKDQLKRLGRDALVVRLDLSELGFMDASGLHVLLDAAYAAGRDLQVEPKLKPQVRRLFELTETAALIRPTQRNGLP